MTRDVADTAAEVMVAFWRRSQPLALRTRQLCGRLAAAVDPEGSLAATSRAEPAPAASPVAAALHAAGRDPEVAGLVLQIARTAAATEGGGEPATAPNALTQRVDVRGNGNVGFTVGRDLHLGVRGLSELLAAREGPQAPAPATADVVLLVAADPIDLDRLRLGEEAREIREALRGSPGRGRWTVDTWSSVRFRDLSAALLDRRPRVVHFSGHGSSEGALFLEDESGSACRVRPDALVELFSVLAGAVECVVLNACYSEPQARAISTCVPFVVGSASAVEDAAAIRFSVGFYQALGAGCTIPHAYRVGCAHFRADDDRDGPAPVLIERRADEAR